jgi:thioredoxin-dependent peroxiredoxin
MNVRFAKVFCLVAAAVLMWHSEAYGDYVDFGLPVGQVAPSFTLSNQANQQISLESLLKKGPVAVVFVASADNCSMCQLRLIQLQRNLKAIEASGGHVVGISHDPVVRLTRFAKRQKITIPLLSDTGDKIIDAYQMRNPVANDGTARHGVFVLDQKGVIRSKPLLMSHEDQEVVDQLVGELKAAQNVNGEPKS